jgi:hypothetical protein
MMILLFSFQLKFLYSDADQNFAFSGWSHSTWHSIQYISNRACISLLGVFVAPPLPTDSYADLFVGMFVGRPV